MVKKSLDKWQFGDFQTPDALAKQVAIALRERYVIAPKTVIEPNCGKGAFIRAALGVFEHSTIIGLDINHGYILEASDSIANCRNRKNVILQTSDFFDTDWNAVFAGQSDPLLIIGNPPWVTSSELSALNSKNIPTKSNFQNRRGIDAITGSGNFDISEWMLLQYLDWLSNREGTIAVLCKYSVARKVIKQAWKKYSDSRLSGSIFLIDAKKHFSASVEACLLVLSNSIGEPDCKVYSSLDSANEDYTIGERDGFILKNAVVYDQWKHLAGQDLRYTWRSGLKHDCSKVMVLEPKKNGQFLNGLGETYQLEESCLYPLLKSSDIGNSRTSSFRKLVLVTQTFVGEDTTTIKERAPKTWNYLIEHSNYLSSRKSSIYRNKPNYSIFGVGAYTFKPWKIAISGLYKSLNFCLIGPLNKKAVVFDDTVNFLSFDNEKEARFVYSLVTSKPALAFLESMIFWDEKRPVTIELLRRLSLKSVAMELQVLAEYMHWAEAIQIDRSGQLSLGLAEKEGSYTV